MCVRERVVAVSRCEGVVREGGGSTNIQRDNCSLNSFSAPTSSHVTSGMVAKLWCEGCCQRELESELR